MNGTEFMKNFRQLLRRPVRNCESDIRGEWNQDGTYVITTTCTHLKQPRITQYVWVGDQAQREDARERAWEEAREELRGHQMCSDPW
jgi:hypothetical protein